MNEQECYESLDTLERQWSELHDIQGKVSQYFEARGFKDISVCGTRSIIEQIQKDIEQSNVEIKYLIELGDGESQIEGVPVCSLNEEMPAVDMIVVASTENYMKIEQRICEFIRAKVISIQELVDQTLRNAQLP